MSARGAGPRRCDRWPRRSRRTCWPWLPNATYPIRSGGHFNGAFGLRLALPWAQRRAAAGHGALLAEILRAAERWFLADRDYPAAWEPSGADFLSPALCEAELMVDIAGPDWLAGFLPAFPDTLLQPVTVTDDSDGQLAHLHGLNLSRAWAWRRLAAALPAGDPRVPVAAGRRPPARRGRDAARDRRRLHGRALAGRLRAAAADRLITQARTTSVEKILSSRH